MNPTDNHGNEPQRDQRLSAADEQISAATPPADTSLQATTQRYPAGAPYGGSAGQSARTQNPGAGQYGPVPTYGNQSAATPQTGNEKKLSFIERLMLRGARGELIRQPWFEAIRRDNADMFVYVSFSVALLIVLVLQFAVSSITMTGVIFMILVRYPVWIALGYAYIALGTKLAHRFLLGTCVVGVVVSVFGVFGAVSAMSTAHSLNQLLGVEAVPMGLLVFVLLFTAAVGALYGYVGLMVYRGIKRVGR